MRYFLHGRIHTQCLDTIRSPIDPSRHPATPAKPGSSTHDDTRLLGPTGHEHPDTAKTQEVLFRPAQRILSRHCTSFGSRVTITGLRWRPSLILRCSRSLCITCKWLPCIRLFAFPALLAVRKARCVASCYHVSLIFPQSSQSWNSVL